MRSKHLQDIDESYIEHFQFSLFTGLKLIAMGCVLIIHGLIPDVFISTASTQARAILGKLAQRKKFNEL